jgi:hypothetical protein
MTRSYLGGSTVIKTRTKGWWKGKRYKAKKNTEKHNANLKRAERDRNLMCNWTPEYTLIKKEDMDVKR